MTLWKNKTRGSYMRKYGISSSPPKWWLCLNHGFFTWIVTIRSRHNCVYCTVYGLIEQHFLGILIFYACWRLAGVSRASDIQNVFCFFSVFKLEQGLTLLFHQFVGPLPPVDLYLSFESPSLKNQVRRTWFFVYFKLNFYCLCRLQKSISKLIFEG